MFCECIYSLIAKLKGLCNNIALILRECCKLTRRHYLSEKQSPYQGGRQKSVYDIRKRSIMKGMGNAFCEHDIDFWCVFKYWL
jgi:hypothetical protein